MTQTIAYTDSCKTINWNILKSVLAADNFDNGRTPDQYRVSFENSFAVVFAWHGEDLIGTARVLSDGVCNAYVVDVWTRSDFRRQGTVRTMMEMLMEKLSGQHVYLFTDDAVEFYASLGFKPQPTGMGLVVGTWLDNLGE